MTDQATHPNDSSRAAGLYAGRAIECWSALAGIADPAAFVAQARALAEAGRALAAEQPPICDDDDCGHTECLALEHWAETLAAFRAADGGEG